jgi:hypothetical protein
LARKTLVREKSGFVPLFGRLCLHPWTPHQPQAPSSTHVQLDDNDDDDSDAVDRNNNHKLRQAFEGALVAMGGCRSRSRRSRRADHAEWDRGSSYNRGGGTHSSTSGLVLFGFEAGLPWCRLKGRLTPCVLDMYSIIVVVSLWCFGSRPRRSLIPPTYHQVPVCHSTLRLQHVIALRFPSTYSPNSSSPVSLPAH